MKQKLQLLSSILLVCVAFTLHAQDDRSNSQLFQGLLQTGGQLPVFAYKDRMGATIGAGLIFDEQVVYKFTYVVNSGIPDNQEHSLDVLLSKYRSPRQWAIGAAYYKSSYLKDIILPALSYHNFRIEGTNFGYSIKLGLSLYALGYGTPIPVAQFNLTYRIGRNEINKH